MTRTRPATAIRLRCGPRDTYAAHRQRAAGIARPRRKTPTDGTLGRPEAGEGMKAARVKAKPEQQAWGPLADQGFSLGAHPLEVRQDGIKAVPVGAAMPNTSQLRTAILLTSCQWIGGRRNRASRRRGEALGCNPSQRLLSHQERTSQAPHAIRRTLTPDSQQQSLSGANWRRRQVTSLCWRPSETKALGPPD